jgi:hypothetical protein
MESSVSGLLAPQKEKQSPEAILYDKNGIPLLFELSDPINRPPIQAVVISLSRRHTEPDVVTVFRRVYRIFVSNLLVQSQLVVVDEVSWFEQAANFHRTVSFCTLSVL